MVVRKRIKYPHRPTFVDWLFMMHPSTHPSIHPQFSSGLGSQVSSKCMHLVCLCCLVDKILIKLLRKKKKKKKKRKIVYFSSRVKSQETIAISHLTIFFLHLFIYLFIFEELWEIMWNLITSQNPSAKGIQFCLFRAFC